MSEYKTEKLPAHWLEDNAVPDETFFQLESDWFWVLTRKPFSVLVYGKRWVFLPRAPNFPLAVPAETIINVKHRVQPLPPLPECFHDLRRHVATAPHHWDRELSAAEVDLYLDLKRFMSLYEEKVQKK